MDSNYIDVDSDDENTVLQIPTSLLSHLPPKTLPVAQLLLFTLPPIASNDDDTDFENMYTTVEPTQNIEDLLPFLEVPSRPTLQKMVSGFRRACGDGKKSLHTAVNPEIAYLFYALPYWGEVLDASEAKSKWLRAERWLCQADHTPEEGELKLQVRAIWSVGFANLPMEYLAKLFSSDFLDSCIVDVMLTLLSLRARLAGDETLIVGTTFAEFIRLLPPIVDGVPAGSIVTSVGGQRYLKKYGLWFQHSDHKRLYNILYRDPNHWTTAQVDFEDKRVRYGDGLKWDGPTDFFEGLLSWIGEYHSAEFVVTEDLPCAIQTDGFNCPIIAVNTIAHNEFGDALWTKKNAKAMRMKAFCDIVKHGISVESISPESNIVDPTDWAGNILAVDVDFNDELLGSGKAEAEEAVPEPTPGPQTVTALVVEDSLSSSGAAVVSEEIIGESWPTPPPL
ncbi:hypothetical protein GGX14DRAFT_595410 [Mycena pura]|uniref:Uncharacterized protein n=1 Tax=Mycena pura TaxID=153505 RepID=A0AAD6VQ01_9AGAR|nr:hypothetical protein GGX14DRAFT_595410 [Mycena pura]